MATNFPGSADSFTNPTSGSSLSSPSHADQHTNVNDAVEAIETALLDGAPLHIDDTNERVGIGTTSPTASLTVTSATDDAKVKIDSNGGSVGIVDATANTNDATGRWLAINPSGGYVGINDSSPSYQLDVNGDINTTGYVNVEGDKLGMAFLGSGGLGGGTTDFTGYFTTKWRNYRVIVDPSWNGSSVFTYMQFLDTSNNPITSGYYSAGINNGTFARWNNQSGQLCYDSSYIGRGGAIIDILGTHADYPAFHITSTAYQTSGVTYDNRISGFLNHSQDVTGLRFYNGAPYGAVYFYGYG